MTFEEAINLLEVTDQYILYSGLDEVIKLIKQQQKVVEAAKQLNIYLKHNNIIDDKPLNDALKVLEDSK